MFTGKGPGRKGSPLYTKGKATPAKTRSKDQECHDSVCAVHVRVLPSAEYWLNNESSMYKVSNAAHTRQENITPILVAVDKINLCMRLEAGLVIINSHLHASDSLHAVSDAGLQAEIVKARGCKLGARGLGTRLGPGYAPPGKLGDLGHLRLLLVASISSKSTSTKSLIFMKILLKTGQ